jgi:hypothetical protein
MAQVTVSPLLPGLKPVTLQDASPQDLTDVIRTYQANGIPYRLHYGASARRYPIAASFVSR